MKSSRRDEHYNIKRNVLISMATRELRVHSEYNFDEPSLQVGKNTLGKGLNTWVRAFNDGPLHS
jgi:hypothetical protein